ncbi:nuclear transport factor 2 family protein [Novosphingobium sp. ERN07]|uniref:nuclear transport factor 2 family protein n=1 Tax=Novosphingobium sp. ERN07 TaxID=2726187 RepID=UPI0014571CE5|nr:nuclear transport factor 2 family protein [Novosphingobium sp. ERN07]
MTNLTEFAQQWIDDWNSHVLERVLDHYSEDAEFRSPFAEKRTGNGIVKGKAALRNSWGPAFALRPNLKFTLKNCFVGHRTLAIHYSDELGREVIETLVFDENGKATFGSGCYA